MTNIPQHWIEKAQYDLDTAKAMIKTGRYLYVLFCSQQAIEKILKAIIAKRTNKHPPRIHNLVRLAELASLELNKGQDVFIKTLTRFYIKTRYPEVVKKISVTVNSKFAKEYYIKTKEMYRCLSNLL